MATHTNAKVRPESDITIETAEIVFQNDQTFMDRFICPFRPDHFEHSLVEYYFRDGCETYCIDTRGACGVANFWGIVIAVGAVALVNPEGNEIQRRKL